MNNTLLQIMKENGSIYSDNNIRFNLGYQETFIVFDDDNEMLHCFQTANDYTISKTILLKSTAYDLLQRKTQYKNISDLKVQLNELANNGVIDSDKVTEIIEMFFPSPKLPITNDFTMEIINGELNVIYTETPEVIFTLEGDNLVAEQYGNRKFYIDKDGYLIEEIEV